MFSPNRVGNGNDDISSKKHFEKSKTILFIYLFNCRTEMTTRDKQLAVLKTTFLNMIHFDWPFHPWAWWRSCRNRFSESGSDPLLGGRAGRRGPLRASWRTGIFNKTTGLRRQRSPAYGTQIHPHTAFRIQWVLQFIHIISSRYYKVSSPHTPILARHLFM